MILETPRLILRSITMADFDAVHSWAGDLDNAIYMSFGPNSEEDTRNFIEGCIKSEQDDPRSQFDFILEIKGTGQAIGTGGIYLEKDWHDRRFICGNLGWILHKDHWKHGYCTEFAAELLRFGFEDCGLHRVRADCDGENYGSYRVMERNGMRREAVKKEAILARDGTWHDQYEYAILCREWDARG